jgi:hypothetical protein
VYLLDLLFYCAVQGFDAPHCDFLVMSRPTMSTSFYMQVSLQTLTQRIYHVKHAHKGVYTSYSVKQALYRYLRVELRINVMQQQQHYS